MAAATNPIIAKYQELVRTARADLEEYPADRFKGRGIVICAGGPRYFTNAWVTVKMLRHHGCKLPIEFWHLGVCEMDDRMRDMVSKYDVTCIDAYKVRKKYPARRLFGWECNPFAIIHSSFEEVIFLDADNVPLIDPEVLLDTPQYRDTGAIFWPDYGRLARTRQIWEICGVEYRDEPEFESGQIVVDKRRCWEELNTTMHLNEHSDFYYTHIHGDKDTFHMAWHICGTRYSMPSRLIHPLRATMCQHDFDDKRIFQHRNMQKWSLTGKNPRIHGFLMEDKCLEFLKELQDVWDGKIEYPAPESEEGKEAASRIAGVRFTYHRIGHDKRKMELLPDNTIGKGAAQLEKGWFVQDGDKGPELCIVGNSVTCVLHEETLGGRWKGRWDNHERMDIELVPDGFVKAQVAAGTKHASLVTGKRFVYIRVGHDKRVISLSDNGQIKEGKADLENVWEMREVDGKPTLLIGPSKNDFICSLIKDRDGVWRGKWNKHEKMPIHLVEVP